MQIKSVALLFTVILFTTTLAQMQKTNKKNRKDTNLNFDGSDDIDVLLAYQSTIKKLKNATIITLRSVGFKLSLVKATLKAAATARRAIKICYTNKPREEFHKCANEEMEKTRLKFETIAGIDQKFNGNSGTTKTPIMLKLINVADALHYLAGK